VTTSEEGRARRCTRRDDDPRITDPNGDDRPDRESGETGMTNHLAIDPHQRQRAMSAERDPDTVTFALATFRKRRGFERSSLAAWLGMAPDQLIALALERRPGPTDPDSVASIAGLADRYGADPGRLAEAIEG